MNLDTREFRRALGRYATGIAVVTATAPDGERLGITVNSFSSVSLNPPLVLFSAARNLNCLNKLLRAGGWAVNVLKAGQRDISQRFATPLCDKWQGIEPSTGISGAPLLPDSLAVFECEPYARYDGGDHKILVGRVMRFADSDDGLPLVFFGGAIRHLDSASAG